MLIFSTPKPSSKEWVNLLKLSMVNQGKEIGAGSQGVVLENFDGNQSNNS